MPGPFRRPRVRGRRRGIAVLVALAGLALHHAHPWGLRVDEGDPGSWRPMATVAGEPVRWDPCRPIHYVVNPAGMPAGGRAVLDEAVAEVAAATGLEFVDDGTTDEVELPASATAPVLVRWNLPAEETEEGGDVLGRAGPRSITTGTGQAVDVDGLVSLTTTGAALDPGDRRERAEMLGVWMHEWGHLVGLDHVEDDTQVMNPSGSGRPEFAAGDRAGLAVMGSGPCVPDL